MIDPDGYRPNVGIILMRSDGSVFWARRISRDGWQFPQGGMNTDETPIEAMYRELYEETGLEAHHVDVLGATPGWLRSRLPTINVCCLIFNWFPCRGVWSCWSLATM